MSFSLGASQADVDIPQAHDEEPQASCHVEEGSWGWRDRTIKQLGTQYSAPGFLGDSQGQSTLILPLPPRRILLTREDRAH